MGCKVIGSEMVDDHNQTNDRKCIGIEYYNRWEKSDKKWGYDKGVLYKVESQKKVNGTYTHYVVGHTPFIKKAAGHSKATFLGLPKIFVPDRKQRCLANRRYRDPPVLLRLL